MTANVRCAGGGQVAKDPAPLGLGPTHYERPTGGQSCGWRGERFALGDADLWDDDPDIRDAQIIAARTAKPCPRCGGQVELIE